MSRELQSIAWVVNVLDVGEGRAEQRATRGACVVATLRLVAGSPAASPAQAAAQEAFA